MPFTYDYPRPMVTVDAVVFRKNENNTEVLLIQRKNYPFEGMWALPGGFVDMDETVEEAVVRELEEETNLQFSNLKQLHTFSSIGRDPSGRNISVMFYGIIQKENSCVRAGDDAKNAQWTDVNQLPDLAFDHNEAINMALIKIERA